MLFEIRIIDADICGQDLHRRHELIAPRHAPERSLVKAVDEKGCAWEIHKQRGRIAIQTQTQIAHGDWGLPGAAAVVNRDRRRAISDREALIEETWVCS